MRIATFTVTRDEKIFFPKWLQNSLKSFEPEDIYVLDHRSSDGSTDCARQMGCNVEIIDPPENPGAIWFRDKMRQTQRDLLQKYDWVLFSETDEFVIANSELGTIRNVIEKMSSEGLDFARCTGFDIVHDYKKEPALDFSSNTWLQQRSRCLPWFPPYSERNKYSKALLSRVPLDWRSGFHDVAPPSGVGQIPIKRIDYLFLIHCHFLDFSETERRHNLRHRSSSELSDGAQLEIGKDLFSKFDSMLSKTFDIPENIKGLI